MIHSKHNTRILYFRNNMDISSKKCYQPILARASTNIVTIAKTNSTTYLLKYFDFMATSLKIVSRYIIIYRNNY